MLLPTGAYIHHFGATVEKLSCIYTVSLTSSIVHFQMAINVVIVLTTAAGGDEAAAIINSTIANLIGIFLSPALILLYVGTSGEVTLVEVFYKLTLRVIVPLFAGQLLRKFSGFFEHVVTERKRTFKRIQEYSLVFIVYTVFCQMFANDDAGATIGDVLLMVFFQFTLLVLLMMCAWMGLKIVGFGNKPKLRVMGLFGCCGKTIALGVPLINAIYEGSPDRGIYTLPLLVWHPALLLLGSYLAPRLAAFVEAEDERLNLHDTTSGPPVGADSVTGERDESVQVQL
jgi:sodium/bile acid cotransporter 7